MLYILLSDQIATRREKGVLSRQKGDEKIQVIQGSLWRLDENTDPLAARSKPSITLTSLEFDGVVLQCPPSEVERLSEQEYELLVSLSSCVDRLNIFTDKEWLDEGTKIDIDSIVFILKFGESLEKVVGRVRYKGPLPGLNGTWFGIELSAVSLFSLLTILCVLVVSNNRFVIQEVLHIVC